MNRHPWVIVAAGFHQKGGMDKANHALADYLLERENPVHLVAHSIDPSLAAHPLARVHMVARPAHSFFLGEFALASRGKKVAREVLRQNPAAQIVSNGGNCIWPGINWAHYVHRAWSGPKRGPLAYRIKDSIATNHALRTEKAAFEKARLIISNSKRTTRELVNFFRVSPDRVHTVYLGSDPGWGPVAPAEHAASRKALGVPDSRGLAVFVGGLGYDDRKGFDVLFRAWQTLSSRPDWDVDLLVAGTGPAAPEWQAKVKQSNLENRIRLLGFTDQVRSVLAAADLLVSPVRYESYGLNVQEAICRGIPAMVTASAGVAEQYDASFAPLLLPDPEDAPDLAERLLAWRANREQWRARFVPFGEKLRGRSWRDTAADFVSIVDQGADNSAEQGCPIERAARPELVGNSRP
jgi:glycosyltransferase involved in cell wall biosynthesis